MSPELAITLSFMMANTSFLRYIAAEFRNRIQGPIFVMEAHVMFCIMPFGK